MNTPQGINVSEEVETQVNEPPTCFRCNKYIYDGTILKVKGHFWHNACLSCTVCRRQVSNLCHVHNQEVYCRADFIRLFGAKCCGCSKVISPSEGARVVNGNAYHAACFTCISCRRSLQTGDYLYLKEDGKLLCCEDYKQATCSEDSSPTDSESDESGSDEIGRSRRTCLNDNQLRVLMDTYQNTKRPSKSQTSVLSQNTGLTQRDVQLWFRNRRRSEKKAKHFQNQTQMSNQTGNIMPSPVPSMEKTRNFEDPSIRTQQNHQMLFPREEPHGSQYQLYCPLDYMVPGSMPPNIDLSNANVCNGEIVFSKPTGLENKTNSSMHNNYFNDHVRQWLTV